MNEKTREITNYFRNSVAAQSNIGIDFKTDNFNIIDIQQLVSGRIDLDICKRIFAEAQKSASDDENDSKKISSIHVIISAKTIKTIFEATEKVQDEITELTGVFYIPAILNNEGILLFDKGDNKLPWFPREYLQPMIEPKLAIGTTDIVDDFISNNVDTIEKIKSWPDYAAFFKEFYEIVSESKFDENTLRNMDIKEAVFELENKLYIFIDKTVNATFNIMNLYNHLLNIDQPNDLYSNFISTETALTCKLIENDISKMKMHCGQMSGEYPLSPSQREALNHFNNMHDGEILAINGPPGTGKTTLLQSIVADMYVERAINKEKAPLIVASSTNNQAVTNIITSFGNIKKVGILNLEERWIEGVNSFAAYFPSKTKVKEAKRKGYQYTNQKGEYFITDIEDDENIEKSKIKLIQKCNEYFGDNYPDIFSCQQKLHEELQFFEDSKKSLLSLAQEASTIDLKGYNIDEYLVLLHKQIEGMQVVIENIRQRMKEWEDCYKRIPFLYRILRFVKYFSKRISIEFRLFLSDEEYNFLNEYMAFNEIKEKYSEIYSDHSKTKLLLKKEADSIEKIKIIYDNKLEELKNHNVILHDKEESKFNLDSDLINNLLDKKMRYMEFWLAIHYFECRWVSGEDKLSEKQRGTNFKNVVDMFYHRLSMITPCLVMTFFMLPKQFLAFGEQKNFFLYNYIDLLIVDEAGQVSPEIAAGAFSLAKKAIVVGDINQIEPVWGVNSALDKALALSNGVIKNLGEFKLLDETGLNTSCSSVMKVAAKCCKYEKFGDKGLFLSEHRRCYNEIIDYCNQLVYKGNLHPMRGKGKDDEKLALKQWPQMGLMQIDSDYSIRKGSSRLNRLEAQRIAEWLKNNIKTIIKAYPEDEKENLIGIITPFKAQVNCIETELKKHIPSYCSKINVGTVHTFQGAERKIIILSTVYGKYDGCFFIDTNKSLMNVAVSRAKDNFFMFGDINCLKDTKSCSSGLLKKSICENVIE